MAANTRFRISRLTFVCCIFVFSFSFVIVANLNAHTSDLPSAWGAISTGPAPSAIQRPVCPRLFRGGDVENSRHFATSACKAMSSPHVRTACGAPTPTAHMECPFPGFTTSLFFFAHSSCFFSAFTVTLKLSLKSSGFSRIFPVFCLTEDLPWATASKRSLKS